MYVEALVNGCDFTNKNYDVLRSGAWFVGPGATGRWCIVMCAGPEFLAENNIKPISIQEAYAKIEKSGNGYADF